MKLVWCTDIHLNFLEPGGAYEFGHVVREEYPSLNAIVVSGDIAEFDSLQDLLGEFQQGVKAPVHFVTGNHDAYGGSIQELKRRAGLMPEGCRSLSQKGPVPLADGVVMVGEDGWYDARNGRFWKEIEGRLHPSVVLSDFLHIRDFSEPWVLQELLEMVNAIQIVADREAEQAYAALTVAITSDIREVIFVTHVPPYVEATWHEGKSSNADWLPWMSSRKMGDVLDLIHQKHPDVKITVLCGHTHGEGVYERSRNLTVYTGKAIYGHPCVAGVFDF